MTALLGSLLLPAAARSKRLHHDPRGARHNVPFLFWHEEAVVLSVNINGIETRAVLDTGATMSVLDTGFAKIANIAADQGTYSMSGPGGEIHARKSAAVSVSIDNIEFTLGSAAISDLSAVSQAMGWSVGCVLGHELFTRYIVDIWFDRRLLALHPPNNYVPPPGLMEYAVHIGKQGGRTIPISIEGHPRVEAMVDIGSSSPLLLSAVYAETIGLADRKGSTVLSATGKGVKTRKLLTVKELSIGGLIGRDIPTKIYNEWPLVDMPAIIGLPMLNAARLIVDFGGNRLWLSHTGNALPSMRRDRSGLGLAVKRDRLLVVHVAPGSPAEEGKWTAGESIVEVDGRRINDSYNSGSLWRWRYGPPGTLVRLKLDDGMIRTLKLADYY